MTETQSSSFISQLLKRSDRLFHLIWQFNHQPAAYTHPTFFAAFCPQIKNFRLLRRSRRGSAHLSSYLLQTTELSNDFWYDFSPHYRRLALLDSATLDRLILYAGAAIYADPMAHILLRQPRQQLRDSIGEDLYEFALKRSEGLVGDSLPFSQKKLPSTLSWKEALTQAGHRCLAQCLAGEPRAITARFQLKFPLTTSWPQETKQLEQRQKTWPFLHRLLTHEVNPEWSSCFK